MTSYEVSTQTLLEPVVFSVPPNKKRRKRKQSKDNLLFRKLDQFFSIRENFMIIYDITNQNSLLSLRLCEFICTTMARRGLMVTKKDGSKVYLDAAYQAYQDSKGKVLFDFFRRNPKTKFTMNKFDLILETNLAQLRCFRFAIEFGVIAYALANFRHIEESMSISTALKRKNRKPQDKKSLREVQKYPQAYAGIHQKETSKLMSCSLSRKKRPRVHMFVDSINLTLSPAGTRKVTTKDL
jgi:hypothetical protein